ncbi:MAG TPA: aldo/keto reductase [Phycisphaeraceae bacterium]
MALRVSLGSTGLEVSPICYGSWQLSPSFWGHHPRETFLQAIRRAFEVGVNFYDTADAYGDGLAEQVLGEALHDLPRDQIVVATKVYWHFHPDGRRYPDLSGRYILQACEASLQRLKMDHIDLYQCHSYDPMTPMGEIVEAMETLTRQGKIRFYGTSNWSVEQMRLGQAAGGRFQTIQPVYNFLQRQIEADLLPYCQAHNVGVLVYSPLARGLLSGKYQGDETFQDHRANSPQFQGERFKKICQAVASLRPIAQRYGLNISQLVLAATLMHPAIHCAIAGIKNAQQIEEAAGAMGQTLSREDYYQVRTALTE